MEENEKRCFSIVHFICILYCVTHFSLLAANANDDEIVVRKIEFQQYRHKIDSTFIKNDINIAE